MSYRDELPISKIEGYILLFFFIAFAFMAGVGAGYILNANKFRDGQTYQRQADLEIMNGVKLSHGEGRK